MSESKLFEELFVVVCVWKFLMRGGGSHLNPNFLRNFFIVAYVWTFSMGGGANPNLLRNFFV
jgi:hypothetical protein